MVLLVHQDAEGAEELRSQKWMVMYPLTSGSSDDAPQASQCANVIHCGAGTWSTGYKGSQYHTFTATGVNR